MKRVIYSLLLTVVTLSVVGCVDDHDNSTEVLDGTVIQPIENPFRTASFNGCIQ